MAEATYELRLRGAVSRLALSIFEEMDLQFDTLLSGVIQDQAALHGLLERIRDLGLELVDVHQITNPQPLLGPSTHPPGEVADASQQSGQATVTRDAEATIDPSPDDDIDNEAFAMSGEWDERHYRPKERR